MQTNALVANNNNPELKSKYMSQSNPPIQLSFYWAWGYPATLAFIYGLFLFVIFSSSGSSSTDAPPWYYFVFFAFVFGFTWVFVYSLFETRINVIFLGIHKFFVVLFNLVGLALIPAIFLGLIFELWYTFYIYPIKFFDWILSPLLKEKDRFVLGRWQLMLYEIPSNKWKYFYDVKPQVFGMFRMMGDGAGEEMSLFAERLKKIESEENGEIFTAYVALSNVSELEFREICYLIETVFESKGENLSYAPEIIQNGTKISIFKNGNQLASYHSCENLKENLEQLISERNDNKKSID